MTRVRVFPGITSEDDFPDGMGLHMLRDQFIVYRGVVYFDTESEPDMFVAGDGQVLTEVGSGRPASSRGIRQWFRDQAKVPPTEVKTLGQTLQETVSRYPQLKTLWERLGND